MTYDSDDDIPIAQAETATPAWVNEGTDEDDIVIEGQDISGAEPMESRDVIDAAKGVTFEIKKAVIDAYTPKGEDDWMKLSLKLHLAVGPLGVDGKGRYKGKYFFPRILVDVNRKAYPDGFKKDYYKPKTGSAFGEYNEILQALGFSTSPAPRNDKAFRQALIGRQVIADIDLNVKQYRAADGSYKTLQARDERGDRMWENFENKLTHYRKAQATATQQAQSSATESAAAAE